ncbi:RMD1 family protein [Glaciecola sp. 1036]|uniref:RMD1 family protein n=1 Tax=Alteromonadaceae TaxID=72275 RepID=UPI003D01A227
MTTLFANQQVSILCFAAKVNLAEIQQHFSHQFIGVRYRDALHFSLPKGQAFVFDYGILVCWGVSEKKREHLQTELIAIAGSSQMMPWEHYNFTLPEENCINEQTSEMHDDMLTLYTSKIPTLLALSHGFAQAIKLEWFEGRAERCIADNAHLTQTLAKTGKIGVGRRQLAKSRGTLFQVKSDIMLNFNLLDTPEFFWDHPTLEADYLAICGYLELKPRIELLNLKLQTIHELLDMLAAEQNHQHSSFLEWIIIILIAVEIVLFFAH